MISQAALILLAAAFFLVPQASGTEASVSMKPLATNSFEKIDAFLEELRAKHKLPALAAAVCSSEKVIAAGAVGVRKAGGNEAVLLSDKFHIGSCTKSMTALLAAILVERGQISWTNRVKDIFPEWKLKEPVGEITLEQLLAHRSGIAYNVEGDLWARAWTDLRGTPREQRAAFLQETLQDELKARPGTKHIYSNTGYALAGAMLEQKLDRSWEDLIRQEIFQPLQMTSAGFGPPSLPNKVDHPWGHQFNKSIEPIVQEPGDNPVSIAPAAAAHCSILDLAQYAAFHLRAAQRKVPWMSDRSIRRLYLPVARNEDYGLGWIVVDRKWAGGKALTHAGSNTTFYTLMWLAPNRDFAIVTSFNVGLGEVRKEVEAAGDDVIVHLLKDVLKVLE